MTLTVVVWVAQERIDIVPDYKKMWYELMDDMERAVEEGFNSGFHNEPNTGNGRRFIAYRYVLDKMNEMEGVQNERN